MTHMYKQTLVSTDLSVLHALGVGSAWRGLAGVWSGHAPLALTHIALLTVRVPGALRPTAGDRVRLGDQPGLTSANGVTWQQQSLATR